MRPWLQYVIAFVVFCHGFIYVRIGAVLPGPITQWNGTSWLLGSAVTGEQLRLLAVVLHVMAGIAMLACAIAIAAASVFPAWWRPLAITAAALGLLAFAVFWDGQTAMLFEEGAIGAAFSLLILVVAIWFPPDFR